MAGRKFRCGLSQGLNSALNAPYSNHKAKIDEERMVELPTPFQLDYATFPLILSLSVSIQISVQVALRMVKAFGPRVNFFVAFNLSESLSTSVHMTIQSRISRFIERSLTRISTNSRVYHLVKKKRTLLIHVH